MSIDVLARLCISLDVPADYLLFGQPYSHNAAEPPAASDDLSLLIQPLPAKKREHLTEIISMIIPYLK